MHLQNKSKYNLLDQNISGQLLIRIHIHYIVPEARLLPIFVSESPTWQLIKNSLQSGFSGTSGYEP